MWSLISLRTKPLLVWVALLSAGLGAHAGTLLPTEPITLAGDNYKDSFGFSWRGKHFLAVSDISRGGLSILVDRGTDDDYATIVERFPLFFAYAPEVHFVSDDVCFVLFCRIPGLDFSRAKLQFFRYDMSTGVRGVVRDVPFVDPSDNTGLIDPAAWYEPGKGWYLAAARHEPNPFGLRLVWTHTDRLSSGFKPTRDLLDTQGSPVDRWRTDIGRIAEAPIWSPWDHDADGAHELYWSIGPSDPYVGQDCHWEVQAIRRGNIVYGGAGEIDISIDVTGRSGGADDWMGANEDCYLLTHPDFTASGEVRGTGHHGGPDGHFRIVQ